jgi:hypothetical protein
MTLGLRRAAPSDGDIARAGAVQGMMVKAAFYNQRFVDGAQGTISIHRADDVPVILLTLNGERIAPDREIVGELPGLSAESAKLCAFALQ